MAATACCRCGVEIPEAHLRAGYVRGAPEGVCCTQCLSQARAAVWTVPEQVVDLHRAAWMFGALSSMVIALWLLHLSDFLSAGIGLFFLVLAGILLIYKVFDARLL